MSKRLLDLSLGAVLALVTLPLVLLFAAAVAIEFRAWPFFFQTRVGMDGRLFRFVKLRTLPVDTPTYADKYEISHIDRPLVADVLRRTHLDELPQLWLVLTGHMSLVGPRPEMPNLHRQMDPDFARVRTTVRPGVTGLWQISDQADRLISEAPSLDLAYLEHAGVWMDLKIVAHTILLALGLAVPVPMRPQPQLVAVPAPGAREMAVPETASAA